MINDTPDALVFVLFGATGDLARREIVPALYARYMDGFLPERFCLLGVGRSEYSDEALAERFRDGVEARGRVSPQGESWARFAASIRYHRSDLREAQSFMRLGERIGQFADEWRRTPHVLYYLSTPPSVFAPVAEGLGEAGLARERNRVRIVVEKPIGYDLASFKQIDATLRRYFKEKQIFRIDHFLGKETVQNILALRFANPMFEPLLNRHYVDHVVITHAETLGMEGRGPYYDQAGALRDMVQNHLLQLLCLTAMEPPVAYDPDDIRNKMMDVLQATRPFNAETVRTCATRGQYGPGWIGDRKVPGYREEQGVEPQSNTETYAALRLYVDSWRWQGVPFYLRAGKRMARGFSEVAVRFTGVPQCFFPNCMGLNQQPAALVIRLSPEQGVVLRFSAKEPGTFMSLRPAEMRFNYAEAFEKPIPDAYETLLTDVMRGDPTLFMRSDQVKAQWTLLEPVLRTWQEETPADFPNYAAGSWGPESAERMIAGEGQGWALPPACPLPR